MGDGAWIGIGLACSLYLIGAIILEALDRIDRWWEIRHPDPSTSPVFLGDILTRVHATRLLNETETAPDEEQ